MKYFYTGIGSRVTSKEVCNAMTKIAKRLQEEEFTLRSGGADGADFAFELGAGYKKEIYLPWKNFNSNKSELFIPSESAMKLASEIHPVWDKLNRGGKLLHARNCHQVLGKNLNTPSDFLICWTLGGGVSGGTATAMKLADKWNIPVYNMADDKYKRMSLEAFVEMILNG